MSQNFNVSLSIQLKQTDAKARIAEIGREFEKLGKAANVPAAELDRLKGRLDSLRSAAKLDVARNILDVRPFREINREIAQVQGALNRLKTAGVGGKELAAASVAAKSKIAALRAEMDGAARSSGTLSGAWGKVTAAWFAFQGVLAAGGITGMVEDMQRLNARLQISEGSAAGAAQAMGEIKRIAQESGTPVRDVADAYVRFSGAIGRTGGSQEQTVKFTDALTKALKISGASAQQTGAVMLQLGQAFDSGRLQGDEFRSVAENGGKVLDYLAKELGVTRGELRQMATDGKLGVAELLRLADAADQINADFEKMPRTVGDALTRIANAFISMASESTALGTALGAVAVALEWVAKNLDKVLATAVVVVLGGWIVAAGGVANAFGFLAKAIGAVRTALAMLAAHPWVAAITLALTALIWTWDSFAGKISRFDASSAQRLQKGFEQAGQELEKMATAAGRLKTQLDQAMKEATAPIERMAASHKTANEQIMGDLARRTDAISEAARRETLAVQASSLSQQEKSRETARIALEAEEQKLTAVETTGRNMETTWNQTYGRAIEIARAAGLDTTKLSQEATAAKIKNYETLEREYQKTVNFLIAEEERLTRRIQELGEERAGINRDFKDRQRSLKQKAMSPADAYRDMVRQVKEKQGEAKEAERKGDLETAKRLWKDSAALAERNTSEIKESFEKDGKTLTKTIVSQAESVNEASRLMEEAGKGLNRVVELQEKEASAQKEKVLGKRTFKGLEETQGKKDEAGTQQAVTIAAQMQADEKSAKEAIAKLQALANAQKVTVQLELAVNEATAAIAAWKNDPGNQSLAMAATLAVQTLEEDLNKMRANAEAAGLEIPADLDTTQAMTTLKNTVAEMNATVTESTLIINPDSTGVMNEFHALGQAYTEAILTVKPDVQPAEAALDTLEKTPSEAPLTVKPDTSQVPPVLDALNATETKSTHSVTPDTASTNTALDELAKRATKSPHTVDPNTKAAQAAINELKKPTFSTHTVLVKKVQAKAEGGLVTHFAQGGLAFRRMVGRISGAGTPTSDSIRAMLSHGEYVIRARATGLVSRLVPGFMDRLNAVSSPADLRRLLANFAANVASPRLFLAAGGPVSLAGMPGLAGMAGSQRSGEHLTVTFRAGGVEAPVRVVGAESRHSVEALVKELNRIKLVTG